MHTIDSERKKYQKAWTMAYEPDSSCGLHHANYFMHTFDIAPQATVADVGCGNGVASAYLHSRGLQVTGIDLVDTAWTQTLPFIEACIWELPDIQADYVFCTDVLEHLPEEKVDLALDNIKKIATKGVYFSIATRPDSKGKEIDEVLHLTVKPFEWWRLRLESRWSCVAVRQYADQEFNWAGN